MFGEAYPSSRAQRGPTRGSVNLIASKPDRLLPRTESGRTGGKKTIKNPIKLL
ncbi:hypothetical protein MAQ5080_03152 [Marinomonas aquimarina]|uniref:Uncharacterized protein n=1 Tax=Marinomonas aquimarina TaxID=295068 RepID=A0A1A8TPS9_9GAMM|nr:hypothetical protein MAQ5080_03152 [Marinomonas aquimarina]